MRITTCTDRPILVPCGLDSFDHQIDPYVGCAHDCRYCYVLDQAETDWTEEIRIHRDLAGRLRAELEGIAPQTIYMGYHSDPYQPCEAERRQTRTVLEILLERGFSASILTKSDLVLRDVDIFREMAGASVGVSVAFGDDAVRRLFEGGTIETRRRIDALAELKSAGIGTSAMICPVIPLVTDVMPLLDAVAPHAGVIRVYGLSVRDPGQRCWRDVREILRRHFPEIREDVEAAVLAADHPGWSRLRRELFEVKERRSLDLRVHL